MAKLPRRALIIGCGYLGSRVAGRLLAAGWDVAATSRDPERLEAFAAQGLKPALLDLSSLEGSPTTLWDVAYDLVLYAVAPGRGGDARLGFYAGALRSLEALRGRPPRRFVYISSTGVYSQRDGSTVDEQSPAVPKNERLRFIREAEEALLGAESEPAAIVLRLGGIYGPGRSPIDWMRHADSRRYARGSSEAYMNWIHVDDAARAVVAAGTKGRRREIYLVVDGTPVRRRDFYELAARLAGTDPPALSSESDDRGKRCSNRKLIEELEVTLEYPDYRIGLESLV